MLSLAAIQQAAATAEAQLSVPASPDQQHLGGSMRGDLGDKETYCPNLWAWAVGMFGGNHVLDLGCGHGHAAVYFAGLGCTVTAIDGHQEALATIDDDAIDGVLHDYATGPRSISRRLNFAWCCEFLEHVEERHLSNVFATLAHAKVVLLTHATPGQGGHHHVNEQTAGYWALQFMQRGFELDETATACARLVAAADRQLLGLTKDNYFMKTGLVFVNQGLK